MQLTMAELVMKTRRKQRGVVLIFIAFIIGLAATALMLKSFNASSLKAAQDEKTYKALNEAKQALIAWAVSDKYSPGQMPWPDRNADGNYDGSSDCVATAFQYSYLLGQLPSQPTTSPCLDPNTGLTVYTGLSTYPGLGKEFRDAQGNRLWYAVSRNLVRDYVTPANPVINSSIVNNPTYQWLQILDRNGNLVSNKVAVVIIAPGIPLGGQNRTGAANASEYLDSFQIGAAVFNNRGYATDDEDFIVGEDSHNISPSDTTFVQPYNFNDKLVYITIDELMQALEKRAASEASVALNKYYNTQNFFPYAAGLNLVTNPNQSVKGNLSGFLPTELASNYPCSCSNTKSCSCHFAGVSSIKYTRSSGTYGFSGAGLPTGTCSVNVSHKVCSCSGAGTCKSSSGLTTQFTCSASGACSSSVSVNGSFAFVPKGSFSSNTGGCSPSGGNMNCSSTSSGTFKVDKSADPEFKTVSLLPAWFKNNNWQDYVYYELSSSCTSSNNVNCLTATPQISVGARQGVRAMLITTGSPVGGHVQPSYSINDYLDSTENTNGDLIYERTDKQRTTSYNDQTFIVAP